MAARRTPKRRRATTQARRKTRASLRRSIARIEDELPATLAQFSRRMGARLGDLEGRIEKAGAVYRRRWTRLLREASHRLGRFEAEGELRWRRLTARTRREALQLLRRLERELAPAGRPRKAARKVRRKAATPRRRRRVARKAAARTAPAISSVAAAGSGI
jgi:hypothetical protein